MSLVFKNYLGEFVMFILKLLIKILSIRRKIIKKKYKKKKR